MNPRLQASWKKHFKAPPLWEKAESAKHATDVYATPVLSYSLQLTTEFADVGSVA
jgi:hypothetical protein